VTLSTDRLIATRTHTEYCNGYVFTQRVLNSGERLVITILDVTRDFQGGLAFGVTSCDPASIAKEVLPDDSDQLLNRPEYWVVHKDMYTKPERGDQLSFHLTTAGALI